MKSKADNNNKYLDDLVNRVQKAESHADCEELRVLLKDVREEVQHLNKVMDHRPLSTSPPTFSDSLNQSDNFSSNVNHEANYLLPQTEREDISLLDSSDDTDKKLSNVYDSHNGIADISFEEISKRRTMLENLVNYLQHKLREETSKRRKHEQQCNAIKETSQEDVRTPK